MTSSFSTTFHAYTLYAFLPNLVTVLFYFLEANSCRIGDITQLAKEVQVIVNAANPTLLGGGGG